VDDDPQKVALVQGFLSSRGVTAGNILTAGHAAAARIVLSREHVDFLIIDVLLPAREGAVARGENSVELLRQIVDDGTTPAPRVIVGMTASLAAKATFEDEYRSLVTLVLHVAPGEDAWRESVSSVLSHFTRVEASRASYDYDICVLNALRYPELDAVLRIWPLKVGAEQLVGRNIVYREGTVSLPSADRRIVLAHLSQMGPIASAHAATTLLTVFRPRVLMMTGICGGFPGEAKLGDLLVAEKSWDWQAGKWTGEGALATASDQRDASAELIADARAVESILAEFYSTYTDSKPEAIPGLVVGPMVTGSAVIASLDIQQVFRHQHRKMAGVDMECYGLYYAAECYAGAPVRTICLKGVSDLADRAKGDNVQRFCSSLSAVAGLEILKRYFSRP
jgi:nucleoside phosphorylase/CheY-like chemotaxis protein